MDKKVAITEMKQTVFACPAMWEVKFDDGTDGYIRYRSGYLSLMKQEGKSFNNTEIIGEQIGDEYDGFISEGKVANWLGINGVKVDFTE